MEQGGERPGEGVPVQLVQDRCRPCNVGRHAPPRGRVMQWSNERRGLRALLSLGRETIEAGAASIIAQRVDQDRFHVFTSVCHLSPLFRAYVGPTNRIQQN